MAQDDTELVVALAGKFSIPKKEIKDAVERHGGRVVASLSKKVTHLMVGAEGEGTSTAKEDKAREMGIQVVDETFLEQLRKQVPQSPIKKKTTAQVQKKKKEDDSQKKPVRSPRKRKKTGDAERFEVFEWVDESPERKKKKTTSPAQSPRKRRKTASTTTSASPAKTSKKSSTQAATPKNTKQSPKKSNTSQKKGDTPSKRKQKT